MERTRQVYPLELMARIGLFILILSLGTLVTFLVDETQWSGLPGLSSAPVQVVTTATHDQGLHVAMIGQPQPGNEQPEPAEASGAKSGIELLRVAAGTTPTEPGMTVGTVDQREDRVYVLTETPEDQLVAAGSASRGEVRGLSSTGQMVVELVARPAHPAQLAADDSPAVSAASAGALAGLTGNLISLRLFILILTLGLALLTLLDGRLWRIRFSPDY